MREISSNKRVERRRVDDIFEVVVAAGVVRVVRVVVAARTVAAPPISGEAKFGGQRRVSEVHAVDVIAYRVPTRCRVDREGWAGGRGRGSGSGYWHDRRDNQEGNCCMPGATHTATLGRDVPACQAFA